MIEHLKRIGLLLAALSMLVACGEYGPSGSSSSTSGGSGQQTPVSIVTWNLHNFVNDKIDSDVLAEEIDKNWISHKKAIAKVLSDIDADVLMLQEIENGAVIEALNSDLGERYPYLVLFPGNDPRGINIALMSKVEVVLAVTHRSDRFKKVGDPNGPSYRYARDCLEVHLDVNGQPLVLLGVHYKAKENDNPDKRLAEAQHTRIIADALAEDDPSRAILILGDFNDTPGSSAYNWTLGNEPTLFYNAADHVQAPERWTFDYKGKLELVDQQMANGVLYGMLDTENVQILHSNEVRAASDHAPIVATYRFP